MPFSIAGCTDKFPHAALRANTLTANGETRRSRYAELAGPQATSDSQYLPDHAEAQPYGLR